VWRTGLRVAARTCRAGAPNANQTRIRTPVDLRTNTNEVASIYDIKKKAT